MKIACFYYTQSGQALDAAKSICESLDKDGSTVVYKPIVPQHAYPFPWSKAEFLDAFPESRLGMPPSGIEPLDFSDIEDADLVMIVGQSWFLSPSLPLQSFFADESVKRYLGGRKVLFVNVCRNMWRMTWLKVKAYAAECRAQLVGHIVLQDEGNNLVGVLTIIRWLMYGKKEASGLLPAAGVSDADIRNANRFGPIIRKAVEEGKVSSLQDRLLDAGAIHYRPSVLFVEKVGHRMFGLWAPFVRKKGGFGDPRRQTRLNLFFAYLLTALYVVSPFGLLVFYLTYPFRSITKVKNELCRI